MNGKHAVLWLIVGWLASLVIDPKSLLHMVKGGVG